MKAIDARIVWTPMEGPIGEGEATRGQVDVLDPRSDGDGYEYKCWIGKGETKWRDADDEDRLLRMFQNFHYMVLHDKLDPIAIHNAFLKIEEYERAVPPEIKKRMSAALDN